MHDAVSNAYQFKERKILNLMVCTTTASSQNYVRNSKKDTHYQTQSQITKRQWVYYRFSLSLIVFLHADQSSIIVFQKQPIRKLPYVREFLQFER